jgi:ABC-type lipoprotein release transport system permease subunit
MMLVLKLAMRNIIGAGLRTWLNVVVLSLAFVLIVWTQGFIQGMQEYSKRAQIEAEVGGGQFWRPEYNQYDPLTFEDSHAPLTPSLHELVDGGDATAILISMGTIYPEGRAMSAMLKGIDPGQTTIAVPSRFLEHREDGEIPGLIGRRMAKATGLNKGDFVTVRWRDTGGTFDAADIRISEVVSMEMPTVDQGQIWIPLERMREMMRAPGEATLVILDQDIDAAPAAAEGWIFRDQDFLLKEIVEMIKSKMVSTLFIYTLLMFMALIAIFDTQVLSIWRRRREMGTMMALGMVRSRIVALFTLEGALHGLLAVAAGAAYGIPIFIISGKYGFPMPDIVDDWGFAIPQKLFPSYGALLFLGTTLLVLVSVTLVSYMPAAKISRLKPTDALRGKMT